MKRILKYIFIITGLLAAIWAGLVFMADPAAYETQLKERIQATGGYTLSVQGEVNISAFPSPSVSFNNVLLIPDEGTANIPSITVQSIIADIGFMGLISHENIKTININTPSISAETNEGEAISLENQLLTVAQFLQSMPADTVHITDATISNNDTKNAITTSLIAQKAGKYITIDGTVEAYQLEWQFRASLPQQTGDAKLQIINNIGSKIEYTGSFARTDGLEIKGNVKGTLTQRQNTERQQTPQNILTFAGATEYKNGNFFLRETTIQANDTKGTVSVTYNITDDTPRLDIISKLETFTADNWQYLFIPYIFASSEQGLESLTSNMQLALNVSSTLLSFRGHTYDNASLKLHFEPNKIVIDEFKASIKDNANFLTTGAITETNKGLRFRGKTRIAGSNLKDVLLRYEPVVGRLSNTILSDFSLNANMFISNEQIRFSEADLKVGELELSGGLVTYFGIQPRVEADIALDDVNLDYFRDVWRDELKTANADDFSLNLGNHTDVSWLRELNTLVSLNVYFSGFKFLDINGSNASFRLYAKPGEIGLEEIAMRYRRSQLKGDVSLNVLGELPNFNISLQIPNLDTRYFSPNGESFGVNLVNLEAEDAAKRWSREIFDFNWMKGWTGNIGLGIGKFTHQGNDYNKLGLKAEMQYERMKVETLSFERFGGKVDASGTLVGGKVPAISGQFTLYNADISELLATLMQQKFVDGRISISGSFSTFGIHFYSWIKQLGLKSIISARGVSADGINIQGVIDAVQGSRFVAEVVQKVEQAINNGMTRYSIDGNLNIDNAIMSTPGMRMSTRNATATLNGDIELLPWTMNLEMLYTFPALTSQTTATMPVDLRGTPEEFKFTYDTSSLEAYVAKRITGR